MTQAAKVVPHMNSPTDPVDVVKACYHAYETKDRAAIEALLADDFVFTSPLDNRIDRKTYFERCWPISENAKKFEFIFAAQQDNRVFLTYESEHTTGKKFRNTEIFTLKNNQVTSVEVYFGWDIPHKAKPGGFINEA